MICASIFIRIRSSEDSRLGTARSGVSTRAPRALPTALPLAPSADNGLALAVDSRGGALDLPLRLLGTPFLADELGGFPLSDPQALPLVALLPLEAELLSMPVVRAASCYERFPAPQVSFRFGPFPVS